MFTIKKAHIKIEDITEINEIYHNLKESLLIKCKEFPEFSFKIRRVYNEDRTKGEIEIKTLDLGVQAN